LFHIDRAQLPALSTNVNRFQTSRLRSPDRRTAGVGFITGWSSVGLLIIALPMYAADWRMARTVNANGHSSNQFAPRMAQDGPKLLCK